MLDINNIKRKLVISDARWFSEYAKIINAIKPKWKRVLLGKDVVLDEFNEFRNERRDYLHNQNSIKTENSIENYI